MELTSKSLNDHTSIIQQAEKVKNVREVIVRGLEKGIMSISENSTVDTSPFALLAYDILKQLLERGHGTKVQICSGQLNLELAEENNAVSISLKVGVHTVRGVSITRLMELQQKLIKDIVCHAEKYPRDAFELALDHIKFNTRGDAPESFHEILHFIVNGCPDENAYKERKAAAAYFIFKYEKGYDFPIVQWAVIFVVSNVSRFPIRLFTRAVNHIIKNRENYSKEVVVDAAAAFIKQNLSFFSTPITNQLKFRQFFEKRKDTSIDKYSAQLTKVLCADKKAYPIYVGKMLAQHQTTYNLWYALRFREALVLNPDIAIFVLEHMEGPAITLWNSQNEITDTEGKRIEMRGPF